ncbi:hypothetical protein CL621_04720 [archaeon]|nr:hypothetical protein [archaeon]|tara:strand:- start:52 stop:792 length:741 start_codon:yes stop_codon:yes gene_type:complete
MKDGVIKRLEEDKYLLKLNNSYIFLDKYLNVRENIFKVIRFKFKKNNFAEIEMPNLLEEEFIADSPIYNLLDRIKQFKVFFSGRKFFNLAHSHEEIFSKFVANKKINKNSVFYQITKKYRPEFSNSIYNLNEFYMVDMYFLADSTKVLDDYYRLIKSIFSEIMSELKMSFKISKNFIDPEFKVHSQEFYSQDESNNDNIEIAHIFQLNEMYSKIYFPKLNVKHMICFGIGIDRLAILKCIKGVSNE